MVRIRERWIITFKSWDHVETNAFCGDFEKIVEDIKNFCDAYNLEVIAIMKDCW